MLRDYETLEDFRTEIEKRKHAYLKKMDLTHPGWENEAKTSIKERRKYILVDVGRSGMYMIEKSTGAIYGIRAYGKVNKRRHYGNVLSLEGGR